MKSLILKSAAILAVTSALIGCDDVPYSLSGKANYILKKANIPVTLNAAENDECAKRQVNSLIVQLQSLNKKQQTEALSSLQNSIRSVVVNATEVAQRREVEKTIAYENMNRAKVWVHRSETIGEAPEKTKVDFNSNTKELTITTHSSELYEKENFAQFYKDIPLKGLLNTMSAAEFEAYVKDKETGIMFFKSNFDSKLKLNDDYTVCGAMATLGEVLSSINQ